jgi:hypothetical protein
MASTLGTLRQYLPELTAPPVCRCPALRCAEASTRDRRTLEVRGGVEPFGIVLDTARLLG